MEMSPGRWLKDKVLVENTGCTSVCYTVTESLSMASQNQMFSHSFRDQPAMLGERKHLAASW